MTQNEKYKYLNYFFEDKEQEYIEEIIEIIKKLPKKLFRYRDISEHNIDNLANNKIWLSKPQLFNDPFDTILNVDIEEMILLKIGKKEILSTMPKKMREKLFLDAFPQMHVEQDKIINSLITLRKTYCMACFSEKVNNLLMWSHYADHHKGICIEYSFEDLQNIETGFLLPILYKKKFDNHLININKTNFFSKAYDWRYEKEWRISSLLPSKSDGKELLTPKPLAIYMGCHFEEKNYKKIFDIAQKMGIPLFKMEMSKNKYALVKKYLSK